MEWETVAYIALGAFAGGFVNGLAGFGTSLFALGWWLQVMPPVQAVALSLAMSVFSGIQGVILVRKAIQWPRLARFTLPGLIGIPIGLQLLHRVDASLLKTLVAVFLLAYGGFFAFRRNLPNMTARTPVIDGLIGFLGGILGAIAGLSGALPTMWCALRPWGKTESRAVLQPYNQVILAISAVLLALSGGYGREALIAIALALPVTLIAAQLGIWSFKRLSDAQFRRLLIALMLISGLVILLREAL